MVILSFTGPYDFLSNYYPSKVCLDGMEFHCVENAYQAAKTEDVMQRGLFLSCTPVYAKKQGRRLTVRSDWDTVRGDIMLALLVQKFAKGTLLAQKLIETGDAYLCELNRWHDNYWGACVCDRCKLSRKCNMLGSFLMTIRDTLISKDS